MKTAVIVEIDGGRLSVRGEHGLVLEREAEAFSIAATPAGIECQLTAKGGKVSKRELKDIVKEATATRAEAAKAAGAEETAALSHLQHSIAQRYMS